MKCLIAVVLASIISEIGALHFMARDAFENAIEPRRRKDRGGSSWNNFKKKYNKHYGFLGDKARYLNFRSSEKIIKKQNAKYNNGQSHYHVSLNEFADWFAMEIKRLYGFRPDLHDAGICTPYMKPNENYTVKESIDWSDLKNTSPVSNQGYCASSYAFSAVGAFESRVSISENLQPAPRFSVQQVIDCTSSYSNKDCSGGSPANVFRYLMDKHYLNMLENYTYAGITQSCQYDKTDIYAGQKCTGCKIIPLGDENLLQTALDNIGPVTVGFMATFDLVIYKGGIYYNPSCRNKLKDLTHSMLLIGHGRDPKTGMEFWKLKNSWGKDWGEDGYLRVAKNKNNHCGIATAAIFPEVEISQI